MLPPLRRPACPPPPITAAALIEGQLWCLDRLTFRALVVDSMAEAQQRHEGALRACGPFRDLMQEQLAGIAECLRSETFEVSGDLPACREGPGR